MNCDSSKVYLFELWHLWVVLNFCKFFQFFKDRHYLEKDWGCYFAEEDVSSKRKAVLEVNILKLELKIPTFINFIA